MSDAVLDSAALQVGKDGIHTRDRRGERRAGSSHLAGCSGDEADNGKMSLASTQQHFAEADGWRQAGDGL